MDISSFHPLKRPRNNNQHSSNEHTLYLGCGFEIPLPTERNKGFLKKWQIPGLGQKMHKMSLEYLVMSNSKEAIKDY